MPATQYVGKAGHLAVMGELCLRGYNVSVPEIDRGDDVFVVRDDTGAMWRLQVKTSRGRQQAHSRAFSFRIRENAIQSAQSPELHFVLVMRVTAGWRFLVMDRPVLRNYVRHGLGTLYREHRVLNITLHNDGRATSCGTELQNHLEDWAAWPLCAQ